jgi:putative iron-regulated protein
VDRSGRVLALSLALSLSLACEGARAPDREALLRETAALIVLPGHEAAAADAARLETAVRVLCAAPTASALDDAQAAWLDAVLAWRRTRSYQLRNEPTIASTLEGELMTPADVAAIETHVASTEALDAPGYVPALGGADKGYFALEYLLFGYPDFTAADDARTLAALAEPRRCTYVLALAADAAAVSDHARRIWGADGGNFVALFTSPVASSAYESPAYAADDLLSGIANAVDGTRDRSLGRPLGLLVHAAPVESPYAGASIALMRVTLDQTRTMWTLPPHGLDALLRARDAELADRVLTEMDAARAAIDALDSQPLGSAWASYVMGADHTAGNAAYDAVAEIETSFATDVASTLGFSVRIMVDGD